MRNVSEKKLQRISKYTFYVQKSKNLAMYGLMWKKCNSYIQTGHR
jgi:hypothetical protein